MTTNTYAKEVELELAGTAREMYFNEKHCIAMARDEYFTADYDEELFNFCCIRKNDMAWNDTYASVYD